MRRVHFWREPGIISNSNFKEERHTTFPSVVAFSAKLLCDKIPGLTRGQRQICFQDPDLLITIGNGIRKGFKECQRQFQGHRWNCTSIGSSTLFSHVVVIGSREAAYIYAISSAGVTYTVTEACSQGNIGSCGCGVSSDSLKHRTNWKWGGCSVNIKYGMKVAQKFLKSREVEEDGRSLMNLHNNKAGRKVVKQSLLTECKCHGVSGSCTIRTCWKTLHSFSYIGDILMKKYRKSKKVVILVRKKKAFSYSLHLRMRRSKTFDSKPKSTDLVYLQNSPNYCETNLSVGSLGTVERRCNRTSKDYDGCSFMCCGRGYNTHLLTRTTQCNCKFSWCCDVRCNTCNERLEMYTCK
ncbi:protein Wnt-7b-like [Tachypleus tridentatus]|uniref:protein Wnt-7b-like n=1 Tax=Tachypleus tridentatus TaxID=6853 RepID=UPI003FCF25BE